MGFGQDIRLFSSYIKVDLVRSKRHNPSITIVHNGKPNDGSVRPDETFTPWFQVILKYLAVFLCKAIIFERWSDPCEDRFGDLRDLAIRGQGTESAISSGGDDTAISLTESALNASVLYCTTPTAIQSNPVTGVKPA